MSPDAAKRYLADIIGRGQTCRDSVEMAAEYLDGCPSLLDRVRFHLHLRLCVGCRTFVSQMRQTIEVLARLPSDPVPAAVRIELIRRFRGWNTNLRPHQGTGAGF
jgi:Putative zinc-finger